MQLDLKELEALARAATPGPWDATRQTDEECNFIGYFIEAGSKTISDDGTAPGHADALFIAAANPAAVLEVIALARASTVTAVAAERERAARLALQWSNARNPDNDGHALRNYAQALRDGVQVSERDSDYHWSKAPAAAKPGFIEQPGAGLDRIRELEREDAQLRNEILGLQGSLRKSESARDKLRLAVSGSIAEMQEAMAAFPPGTLMAQAVFDSPQEFVFEAVVERFVRLARLYVSNAKPDHNGDILKQLSADLDALVEEVVPATGNAQAAEIVQVLLYMSGNGLITWQGTGNDEDDAWNGDEEYRTTLDAVQKGLAAHKQQQVIAVPAPIQPQPDPEWPAGEREAWKIGRAAGVEATAEYLVNQGHIAGVVGDDAIRALTAKPSEAIRIGGVS